MPFKAKDSRSRVHSVEYEALKNRILNIKFRILNFEAEPRRRKSAAFCEGG